MFGTRALPPTYATRVGRTANFAADGAPFYQLPASGTLLTWAMPVLALPPLWVMTERPQLTKQGYKSAANP